MTIESPNDLAGLRQQAQDSHRDRLAHRPHMNDSSAHADSNSLLLCDRVDHLRGSHISGVFLDQRLRA